MGRKPAGDRAWIRSRTWDGKQYWELVAVVGGERVTRSFASQAEAIRERDIFAAQIEGGAAERPASWDGLTEAFLGARRLRPGSAATYRYRLAAVATAFADRDPLALSARDGAAYVLAREGQGRSPTTVRGEVDAFAIVQRWCVARGWVPVATWDGVERPELRRRETHLRPEEIGAWLRAAERLGKTPPGDALAEDWSRWPAAAWLLLHGLRSAEVQHVLVRDVDLVHHAVHVVDRAGARTKSRGSERVVPVLSPLALEALRSAVEGRGLDEPAIPMGRASRVELEDGTIVRDPAASIAARSKWLARRCATTCDEAGIRHLSPHALRHTVATLAITSGADVHSVQALLGHEDARVTTRIYSHAIAGAQAMGAARAVGDYLDRAVAARPTIKVVR